MEQVDDFFRNFLLKNGFKKTLNAFQEEWYELETKKKLKNSSSERTPDIYLQNELLQQQTATLKEFVEKSKIEVSKTKQLWEKMKKESDYYKMHHSR